VIKDVAEMKLDVKKRRSGTERELQFEVTRTSKRKYEKLAKMRLKPLRRIVDMQ
jgi:hypothetical protein